VTLMQASILLRAAAKGGASSSRVAEGFCATRFGSEAGWGAVFGAGKAAMDVDSILRRAWEE
jgi:hypothetical protein